MILTIKLSLWSFVRLGGFLLVFGVLTAHGRLLWCCSKSETILGPCASNTRRDRRDDFERSKGGWRYHPAGALGKNTRQFFSIRMTDEQRYPPNRTLLDSTMQFYLYTPCPVSFLLLLSISFASW